MKSLYKLVLSLSFAVAGLFGLQDSAMALTQQSATICKPYNYANGVNAELYTSTSGVFNFSDGGSLGYLVVACPIVRTTAPGAGGFHVWVSGNGPAYCGVYSYDFYGNYLGSNSYSFGAQTFGHEFVLPQSQVPAFSSQSIYCSMSKGAALFNISPV